MSKRRPSRQEDSSPPAGQAGTDDARSALIRELLRQRAKERGTSSKWNAYTLMLAYMILMVTVLLAIGGASMAIVASVAILGLVVIWMFSRTQAKRMEESFFRDEMRVYADMLSSQPPDPPTTSAPTGVPESPLTDRECEVLSRIASGNTNKQIASALKISEQTVKNHISHIFTKMDVTDRTSAVLLALRHGWIKGDASRSESSEG